MSTIPAAIVAGLAAISLLVWVITNEDSVQLSKSHVWAEQFVSEPLLETVTFTQEVEVPKNLARQTFLIGLFFGCPEEPCSGGVRVSLTQDSLSQTHTVSDINPAPSLRRRFKFDGFAEGPAMLTVSGLPGNSGLSPGILYIKEGTGASLKGLALPESAHASVDWFKVMPGERKLPSVFPHWLVSLLWLGSFVGLFSVAWVGLKPENADPPAETGNPGPGT